MFRSTKTRRQNVKKGLDGEDARRKRDEITISIRKTAREEQVQKRRQRRGMSGSDNKENSAGNSNFTGSIVDLPRHVAGIRGSDPKARFDSCQAIRKILSVEKNPPIQQVLDSGVARNLVQFLLADDQSKLQFEACWALTNIASGTTDHTNAIVKLGAIPKFIRLLGSGDSEVREQAVWALGNVAGDSPSHRDIVLRCGALPNLLRLVDSRSNVQTLRNLAWTLSNLCRGKPQPRFDMVKPMLPVLRRLLTHNDNEVLTDTCWALSYVSDDTSSDNVKIQCVIEIQVVQPLVNFLKYNQVDSVKTPALRTIGNIVTGNDRQTQAVIQCGALPALKALLNNPKKSIRKEACWTVSNITAGNSAQIAAVIKADLIPPLVNIMNKAEFDVKKEACWAIANALSGGTASQKDYMISQAIVEPLSQIMKNTLDAKIILVSLDALEQCLKHGKDVSYKYNGENKVVEFLEECQGLDIIEDLQRHDNEEVYEKAVGILSRYFESEEQGDDEALQPSVNQNANQFSFGNMAPSNSQFSF